MNDYQSLSHTKWECKYPVVFIPKYRRKAVYGELRRHLGEIFRELARQKESRVEEGPLQSDHVHILLSLPPKYAGAQVVGISRGRVRFLSRERMGGGGAILSESTSGRGAILSRRWDGMKKRSVAPFRLRRRRTNGWSNSTVQEVTAV